ncbi:MAG: restriction endonuclease [Candidatus Bathyarchaeota archaeon]|nr:MAG: restriction endonuclease [Candidatus Bathyarchaeum tardum]WNZ29065.1 MAG: restriction endonuclease [Candidatus Bathyarchaeota archaeon]
MSRLSLTELAQKYFRQNGYKTEQDAIIEGNSGSTHKFDLIIKRGKEKRSVWIKDWNRTVGVNMIINIDNASEDIGYPKPIIISEKFSGHAKAYANRRSITLLSKQQILRLLG